MNIFSITKLLLGLTFFLFGMKVMSSNLERLSGGKLERLLKKATANPGVSLLLGALITIAVQSSSATTVMLVGLVNSGIMEFGQTLYVIFGANIGTTLTSWILSLSGIESSALWLQMLKPENFSPIVAFVGILMTMICKKERNRGIGTIFVGFAVLMYGMELMKNAVSPLADMPEFSELMVKFNNPVIGVLVGTLFTALIQSSAASIGILQALSLTGSITCGMAAPIVMGQNIGTCVTSLISCIGTSAQAKRVAVLHLSVKVIGTLICLPLFELSGALFASSFMAMTVDPVGIALIHTVFNLAITALLMPLSKFLIRLAGRLVHDDGKAASVAFALDERLLKSPSVAIGECDDCTARMAELAADTIFAALPLLSKFNDKIADRVLEQEDRLDLYEDNLGTWLVRLSAQALSAPDSVRVSKMLHVIGNFERLGDHAVNLLKVAREIHDKDIRFSSAAQRELAVLNAATVEVLNLTTDAYVNNDPDLAGRVEPLEQVIDRLIAEIRTNHIQRLQQGACTIEMGFVLSDMLTNYERISDHCSNIAVAVIETIHGSFDTHKYLNGVKYGNSDFNALYNEFREKYTLAAEEPAPEGT